MTAPACAGGSTRALGGNAKLAETMSLENECLKVDISVEPTLQISVTDKRSGCLWQCPGAPFALHYWDAPHFAARCSPTDQAHGWEFRLIPDEERIALQCAWPRAACGFRPMLHLDGASLEILFPGRRLVENRQFDVRAMAVDVLPGFGGARTGEDGFLLIPRGRGALCRFNRGDERETPLLFYVGGDRGLTAPVFGLARGTAGFLGHVSQGEFDAELVVAANRGPERNLNYAYPRLRIRFNSADPLHDMDHRVRYTFLTGDDASWVGMARAYRRYLVEQCRQPSLAERVELRPLLDRARTGPTVHIQLAEKRRKSRMTGDGELVVKTRFAEVPEMARQIQGAGIENAVILLVGWNCEGRDGLYPTRFPVESAVGGADAMSEALAAVHSLGLQVGALDNYTDMYRRSPAFNAEFSAKQLGGGHWRGGIWAGGQSYVICPQQALERHARRDMRRLRDLGLEGMLLLDHCPGPGVLRCYDENHPATRSEFAQYIRELIRAAQSTFGLCRVSGCSVFAALAADSCMCSVQETPAIDDLEREWFADEPVPFLPTALHGIVLLAANVHEDPLRVVEYGAAPVYSVSAGELGRVLPDMVRFCCRYKTDLAPLADEFIESHQTPGEGLVKVGYSGGAEVLINRTDQPAAIDGVTVGPRDFQVKR